MLVNPRPGANRDNLLAALRGAHTAAYNARRAGGTVVDRYNTYLQWVNESTRMLRGQISSADLDRLVLTKRYWLLQSLLTSVVGPVGDLVSTELDEREAALEDAYQALDRQIARWSRAGAFVVADSSFYIHHPQKLEELDLRKPLRIWEEPVHLLVPIIVVDELDGLKQSKERHTRWRARHTLMVLDQMLADPARVARLRPEDFSPLKTGGIPRGEMTVELVFDPPGHVRLPINDDEIIDRTLAIQSLAARPVTVITYDTHQSTRGRAAGLTVEKLAQPPEGQEPART